MFATNKITLYLLLHQNISKRSGILKKLLGFEILLKKSIIGSIDGTLKTFIYIKIEIVWVCIAIKIYFILTDFYPIIFNKWL